MKCTAIIMNLCSVGRRNMVMKLSLVLCSDMIEMHGNHNESVKCRTKKYGNEIIIIIIIIIIIVCYKIKCHFRPYSVEIENRLSYFVRI